MVFEELKARFFEALDRNPSVDGVYRLYRAQRAWAKARSQPKESKLAKDGPFRDYVTAKLAIHWSPEQIFHALVIEFSRRREHAGGPPRRSIRRCTSRPAAG